MDPRAGLDGYEKSQPHRDSITGPSVPWRVANFLKISVILECGVVPSGDFTNVSQESALSIFRIKHNIIVLQ